MSERNTRNPHDGPGAIPIPVLGWGYVPYQPQEPAPTATSKFAAAGVRALRRIRAERAPGWLSTREAAERLGLRPYTLHKRECPIKRVVRRLPIRGSGRGVGYLWSERDIERIEARMPHCRNSAWVAAAELLSAHQTPRVPRT